MNTAIVELAPKYGIGTSVFLASTQQTTKSHPCPDCKGSRAWKGLSPAGEEYSFPCPRCAASYRAQDELSLNYQTYVPYVEPLTIGSVRTDTAAEESERISYMCVETGIGSGNIYYEYRLHPSQELAEAAALLQCASQNSTGEFIVKRYNQSLSVADYTLSNGRIEEAKKIVASVRYTVDDLLNSLESCDTIEDVRAVVKAQRGEA